ncbi:MAG: transcription elongation factor GreAB [Verrucomicrobiaceae bacterium]|nr:MAG: transcription elongation factor GreAB [Verrucomicrobiaceae bacterium]
MNKQAILQQIIAQLDKELESYARSARAAHAEATDEQNKAENKYDTRGLEASYLARGQSLQAAEAIESRQHFERLEPREFGAQEPIDIGALVEVETGLESSWYFIGPRAGGTEIVEAGTAVLVLTPQSPLGRQLQGRVQGERFKIEIGSRKEQCRIARVV